MANKGPGAAPTYDASTLRIGILHARWNTPIISSLVSGARSALLSAGVPARNIITQSVPGAYELPLAVQRMYTASQTTSTSTLVSAATDLLGSMGSLGSSTDLSAPTDLLGSGSMGSGEDMKPAASSAQGKSQESDNVSRGPLDAIIAIGVLIKGSTMHFEYIADAVSHGLMKVQLDSGCPVVFGLLTCLSEDQAYTRAGMKGQGSRSAAKGINFDGSKQSEAFDVEGAHAAGAVPNLGGGLGASYAEQGHNHGEDWGKAAVEMGVKRRGWGEGKFIE